MPVQTPESRIEELYDRVMRLEKKHSSRKGVNIKKTKKIGEVEVTMTIENINGPEEVEISLGLINKELKL